MAKMVIVQMEKAKVLDNMDESYLYDTSFTNGELGDYVFDLEFEDTKERKDFIESFFEGNNLTEATGVILDLEKETVIFGENTKECFFKERFNSFKEKSLALTMEDFLDVSKCYELKKILSERYLVDYFFTEDGTYNLDDFMRKVIPGEVYYIGGIVGYHA